MRSSTGNLKTTSTGTSLQQHRCSLSRLLRLKFCVLTVTCARAAQHRPSPATVPLLQVQQTVLHRGLHHLHSADATAADTADSDADADIYPYTLRASSPITAYLA